MLSPRLASRYAKSLMLIAVEQKQTDLVVKDMRLLQETLQSSAELRTMFTSPIVPYDKKLKVVDAVFQNKLSAITHQFINLLVTKGREKHLVEMVSAFIDQYNVANQIVKASLTTAVPVEEVTLQQVKTKLLQNQDTKGVELVSKVDADILGGFILQYGDKLLNDSVSRKLHIIKNQIKDNSYISKI